MTAIEWTHRPGTVGRTWNPVTGCTKVSAGCKHCYAETVANRFWAKQYPQLEERATSPRADGGTSRFTYTRARAFTDVQCHEDRLAAPLRWRAASTVFVNSMSDLFHEDVPDAFIDQVFAVMALCRKHDFVVLTKRPARMLGYFTDDHLNDRVGNETARIYDRAGGEFPGWASGEMFTWSPLPNVILGVSVEDQATADARIPLLLQAPAALRCVSAEPLLGPIDLDSRTEGVHALGCGDDSCDCGDRGIDWLIVGGESGPQARPCEVAWIRSLVNQARSALVPCFVKQLGAFVIDRNDAGFEGDTPDGWPCDTDTEDVWSRRWQGDPVRVCIRSRKGGDPSEWPADLRVREWPKGGA